MERIAGGETEKPCPSCGSDNWRDNSQKRDFIRLRQVIAETDARQARIGDDSDEREIHFFDRWRCSRPLPRRRSRRPIHLPMRALPFGFEYIRQCNFREINFGEPREGQGVFKAAGRDAHGGGFRSVGTAQDLRNSDEGKVSPSTSPDARRKMVANPKIF